MPDTRHEPPTTETTPYIYFEIPGDLSARGARFVLNPYFAEEATEQCQGIISKFRGVLGDVEPSSSPDRRCDFAGLSR